VENSKTVKKRITTVTSHEKKACDSRYSRYTCSLRGHGVE